MRVLTVADDESKPEFLRLKRKAGADWRLLAVGEWAETPMHQGDTSVWLAASKDLRSWALLRHGFPRQVVAVAATDGKERAGEVAAQMMAAVWHADLTHTVRIEVVRQRGQIDFKLFWRRYSELVKAGAAAPPIRNE